MLHNRYPVRKCASCGSSTPAAVHTCTWCNKGGDTRAGTSEDTRYGARHFDAPKGSKKT